jgi:vancomycin permeability regulator SanA
MRVMKLIGFLELIFLLPVLASGLFASYSVYDTGNQYDAAVVFGASVINNSFPSKVLQLRLDKAIALYDEKVIATIIVSGDTRNINYNEPEVMQNYLVDNGIPLSAIRKDILGEKTLETCKRIRQEFNLNRIILVTQDFHIPRAHTLCTIVGLDADIAPSLSSSPSVTIQGAIREYPALMFNLGLLLTDIESWS